jgi:secreted PhoX family phosphatase
MDDGLNGQVYFYVGQKQATGSDLDKAGLTNGHLFGIKVDEMTDEGTGADPLGADGQSSFSMVDLGDVASSDGATLDAQSEAAGVTSFLRPEDGAWDTVNHDRFYFVTTDSFNQPSRLWAVDFDDASHPEQGGTIRLMLDGSEGQHMLDNITVNAQGHVILQEDVGGNAALGKIWDYDPFNDTMTLLAQHDPDRFLSGGANFLTQDEESSGIVDVTDILGSAGQNAYLLDVQAHFANGSTLVEGGQLLLMHQDLV